MFAIEIEADPAHAGSWNNYAFNFNLVTKFHDVGGTAGEVIVVSRLAPKELVPGTASGSTNVFCANIDVSAGKFSGWPQHHRITYADALWTAEPEILFHDRESSANPTEHWKRWRLADIFPDDPNTEGNEISLLIEPEFGAWRDNIDVGALNYTGIPRLSYAASPSDYPQTNSRNSQNAGEPSKSQRVIRDTFISRTVCGLR